MIRQKGQLYWDDDKTDITEERLSHMINVDYEKIYDNAMNYFSNVKDTIPPFERKDFYWVKSEYTVPYFVDLAFSYKNTLYGILFEVYGKDKIINPDPLWDFKREMCRKYNVKPCIFPFHRNGDIMKVIGSLFNIFDADRYFNEGLVEPVDPFEFSTDKFTEESRWEMLNTAVIAMVEKLVNEEKVKKLLYHSFPDVYPNIFWVDGKNRVNWMIMETVKERESKPVMPEKMINTILNNGAYGHYALCEFSNPYAPNVYPRGVNFDLRMEITDF